MTHPNEDIFGPGKLSSKLGEHQSVWKKWKRALLLQGKILVIIHACIHYTRAMYWLPAVYQEVYKCSGVQRQITWPLFSENERWQVKSQILHSRIRVGRMVSIDVQKPQGGLCCVCLCRACVQCLGRFSWKWCLSWILKDTEEENIRGMSQDGCCGDLAIQ